MMKNNRIRKCIVSNKGTSIVEMLICFLLLSILMVAASQMIASSMKTYSTAKRSIAGREVSDVIADQIEGVLEKAYGKKAIKITTNNAEISFSDCQRRKVRICTYKNAQDNEYLDMIYGKNGESHWKFDEGIYRGYSITSMKFIPVKPLDDSEVIDGMEYLDNTMYRKGTIKLELELSNPKEGIFTAERYINCIDIK